MTLITGRLFSGTRHVAEALGIHGPVGCVDGSQIMDARTRSPLRIAPIRGSAALQLRDMFAEHDPVTFLMAQDAIVCDSSGSPFAPYVRTWSTEIVMAARTTGHEHWEHDEGILAALAIGSEKQIFGVRSVIEDTLHLHAQAVVFPIQRLEGQFGLIVRASGHNKGSALHWIASHHRVGLSEAVAVGDWLNDMPMLQAAGRSFSMGGAPPPVQESARATLTSAVSAGGGVAEAIRLVWEI